LVTPKNHNKRRELSRYALYRGLFSRVARQLGVDRSLVSRVANGKRKSKRVEQALREELRRIEDSFKS
jgi:transcriptional regulator with XRE-family HTH domain